MDLKRQFESIEKELRICSADLNKAQFKEETYKSQISQSNEKILDAKEEITTLKQEKEKLFSKVDHLLYENDNLRNELYMMKKMMLEIEKRDIQSTSLNNSFNDYMWNNESNLKNKRFREEVDEMRKRPEKTQYEIISLASKIKTLKHMDKEET